VASFRYWIKVYCVEKAFSTFESESPIIMYEKNSTLLMEEAIKSCVDTSRSKAKEISVIS